MTCSQPDSLKTWCFDLDPKGAKVVEKLFPNVARRTARSGLNPPPPVEGGTGVFFNGHGSGPESGPYLERL